VYLEHVKGDLIGLRKSPSWVQGQNPSRLSGSLFVNERGNFNALEEEKNSKTVKKMPSSKIRVIQKRGEGFVPSSPLNMPL